MKVAKIKKEPKKEKETVIREEYSAKQMGIIIVILVVIFGLFYFITTLVVKPKSENNTLGPVKVDSVKTTLGSMLKEPVSEYYVLAYKSQNEISNYAKNYIEIYDKYITDYSKSETALKFYKVDLSDALNKPFMGDILNITNNLEELKLNDEVLFKIKNGNIESYYVGSSNIILELSKL